MLIYRHSSILLIFTIHVSLTLVLGQISLNRLQNGEVIVNRHSDDPQPLYHLPTLIVPGSIEYQTTVDGVVIKFTTAMELTRTTVKPMVSKTRRIPHSTQSPHHDHAIRPTKVHEGVIKVLSDSNISISFDDPDSMIPLSSWPVIDPSITLPTSSFSSSISQSPSSSRAALVTVSPSESLSTFSHSPTPVLPVFPSSESLTDQPYASFFPLPFEESPFEALRSKVESSISPTSSSLVSRGGRVWKTLTSPRNPWRRLFGQQINHGSVAASSITRNAGQESSNLPSSSRDAHRVRL